LKKGCFKKEAAFFAVHFVFSRKFFDFPRKAYANRRCFPAVCGVIMTDSAAVFRRQMIVEEACVMERKTYMEKLKYFCLMIIFF